MQYLFPLLFLFVTAANAQTEAAADSLQSVGGYAAATPLYEQLYTTTTSPMDRLRVGLNYAVNQQRQGEHQTALQIFAEILADTSALAQDSILALAYHKRGVSYYYADLQPQRAAIAAWQTALKIRQAIYPPTHPDIIKGYRNLGTLYNVFLEYDSAEVNLKYALANEQQRTRDCTTWGVDLSQELGRLFLRKGDFSVAENYLRSALSCSKIAYADNVAEVGDSYSLLALLYRYQQLPKEMIAVVEEELKFYEQQEKSPAIDDRKATAFNHLGIAYEWLEDADRAEKFYQKSIAINQKYAENASFLAENYNNLAGVYLNQGTLAQALQTINLAIIIGQKNKNAKGLASRWNTKAEILLYQKQYQAALTAYQRSINYFCASADLNGDKNPDPQRVISFDYLGLIQSLADKSAALAAYAEVENSTKNLTAALHTLDTVSILIGRVRTQYESDASKTFLTEQSKTIFEQALELCFQLAEVTKDGTYYERAFAYAERSKAVILLEAVKEATAKQVAGIPADLLQREQQLKRAIATAEEDLFIATEADERNAARNQLLVQQRALENLVDTFEQQYVDYFNLKYEFSLPTVSEVQGQLSSAQGVLEYFVGKKNVYAFYIEHQQFKTFRLPLDFELRAWVTSMRTGITKPFTQHPGSKNWDRLYTINAQRLYEKLLQPIFIKKELPQQLQIIPDDILGYLPFDALLTDTVATAVIGQFGNYPYLQNQVQLSYNFSLALAQETSRLKHSTARREILAFAPSFSDDSQPLQLKNTIIYLPEITETRTATQAILEQYAGEAVLDAAANKATFLQRAGDYAFLHLATHGQMNDENADYSFIAFAQTGDTIDRVELLFVNDIYNLNLPAEMVVLSACETAIGELQNGEGIISLARAFSYAGAQSIVTTLWQVNDQETGKLMEYFYEELGKRSRKDMALHQAKNRLRADFAEHPYYWAGFFPIGEMGEVKLIKRRSYWWGIGVLGMTILSITWYWQRKIKNKLED